MPAKAVAKKPDSSPKQETPKKAPKKAPVATAPENKAHHATLTETKCNDCAVGLLKQYASESLRNQKKIDPSNQKYHLLDNEEIEFVRTNPLTLQLVGLRRERSLSNKFDDLMVVLYNPPLIKEGEKTVLDVEGLRNENLESTQAYVDAILGASEPSPPTNWPTPGTDVSCPQCKHWRVSIYPITTEPGYDPKEANQKDEFKRDIPNYANLTLLPPEVGAVAPGIYNDHYRVGLHLGTRKPPSSFAALQLVPGSIPARRRYPVGDFLQRSESAYKKKTDDELRKELISNDSKAQKAARAKIEEELGKTLPHKTAKEKEAFTKAVQDQLNAENLKTYEPKIAERRKAEAKKVLDGFKAKIGTNEKFIRLEDAGGTETQNFESEGNQVSHVEVVDDDKSPTKLAVQLVFKVLPPATPPTAGAQAAATAPAKPKILKLTSNDILVTFATAAGTNMHRSAKKEGDAWIWGREVNNWSEGCQVFRSPTDFSSFMRMAMLSKRALCPSRTARCGTKLTVADVEKAIGANTISLIKGCPKEFAKEGRTALEKAFTPEAPDPKVTPAKLDPKVREAVEKLVSTSKAYKELDGLVQKAYWKLFPTGEYYSKETYALIQTHAREKVLGALTDKSMEQDVTTAVKASAEELEKKLNEVKEAWVTKQAKQVIEDKHGEYLEDGLEPCDFGDCGFKFDYMLAETSQANMEAFVAKLGDRGWNSLFPEDTPRADPKPPKQSKPPPTKSTTSAPAKVATAPTKSPTK
jgi:hypothetical protein